MSKTLILYGATGYTGQLIAQTAIAQGLQPVLAGRTASKIAPLAHQWGVEYCAFALEDVGQMHQALAGAAVLLNCAGPFRQTAKPLIAACLQSSVHYLDLAGEVPEVEAVRQFDTAAQQAGILLLSGAGFGIVPTDCVAMYLKNRLPTATNLVLAYATIGSVSQGTAQTVLKELHRPGFVRREGALMAALPAATSLSVDFGQGAQRAVYNPWRADLVTAYHTTGIPNIETYTVFPNPIPQIMQSTMLRRLWEKPAWQRTLTWLIGRLPAGPTARQLQNGSTHIWGQARAADGQTVTVRLAGPEAYLFTAQTAIALTRRILAGDLQPGWQTPARLYGAEFITTLPNLKFHE